MPRLPADELAAVKLRTQIRERQWYAPTPELGTAERLEASLEARRCSECFRWCRTREGRPECAGVIFCRGPLRQVPPEVLAYEASGG